MKRFLAMFFIMMLAISIFVPNFYAQEEEVVEGDYFYGEIIDVSGQTITVREIIFDELSEEMAEEITVQVLDNTTIENLEAGLGLKKGMEVDVEYSGKDGDNEAKYIYVYTD